MTIEGLTPCQVAMADKLWSLKSDREYNAYLATLNDAELHVAMTVSELMVLAEIDDAIDDLTVANLMLLSIGVPINPFE